MTGVQTCALPISVDATLELVGRVPLVLVTDGQVGNEDQILRLLAPRLAGVRVYTVGVDTAVNEGFLKRLAGLGGGACELVESEDRLDAVMDRVHRRIGTPVVTDLELEPSGLDADLDSIAPRRLPALFAGAPLVVCGRFRGQPGGALTVRGRDAAGQPWSAKVPATVSGTPALAGMWARAHLRDLEDRYATDPAPDRDLERRIVALEALFRGRRKLLKGALAPWPAEALKWGDRRVGELPAETLFDLAGRVIGP